MQLKESKTRRTDSLAGNNNNKK